MASRGTFTSGRYGGGSNGPWLTLAWTQVSQSVANNTTTLDLTLRFHWSGNIYYTFHNRSGSLQGHSYTYSGSASGTSGSRVLRTQRVTISHNSNGARSVTLSGNITGLGLNWSGTRVNTMSVSGTANLNTIPRASSLSAFSFNANLKNGSANQINYTVDRKSTGFRHHIQLRDGNTVVKTWDNISSNGKSTLPLTASEVNTLLNRMKTSTTKSYTLRVRTRSGSGGSWIGSAVSRNATARVHADVKPSVGSVSLSQTGNPVSSHTLQGFSKIKASFTRSAGYGASISSSSIQVRRRSGGADSQTINSNSGTTSNPVSLNGVYEARGTARDSRGRTTHTAWSTITVTPYRAPTITNFSVSRNGSTPTTVNISRATTHTVLGTSNHLTYTIQRRQGTGAWTNVNSGATGTITTSGATGSATSTGNAVTQSYEFRLVVTDKLGGRAESLISVSTQRVVLDIHKNEGVGIGKIHEQGILDIDGDVYSNGILYTVGGLGSIEIPAGDDLNDYTANGFYHNRLNAGAREIANTPEDNAFSLLVQRHAGIQQTFTSYGGGSGTTWRQYIRHQYNGSWGPWRETNAPSRGSNSNGEWVRFSDGTQIAWRTHTAIYTSSGRFVERFWTPPVEFSGPVFPSVTRSTYWGAWKDTTSVPSANFQSNGQVHIRLWAQSGSLFSSGDSIDIEILLLGRWK